MLSTDLIPAERRESRRLMVVLHGLGDSLDGYRWVQEAFGFPWMNYLLVNAPDPYYGGFSWYDFAGDPAPGIARSRELLAGLLESQSRRGFSISDIVMFGFSQGCLMTLETGLRYPEKFAGLVGVSGYVHDLDGLLRGLSPVAGQQRVLMTHGTLDPMIPIDPVREQARRLRNAGIDLTWREFNKAHTIAGEDELRVIREFVLGCFSQGH